MLKTTFRSVFEFRGHAQAYLASCDRKRDEAKKPKEGEEAAKPEPRSKFEYALRKVLKKSDRIAEDYNDTLSDIQIDNALDDPTTKELLKDSQGQFKYSKEGAKARNKAARELLDKPCEIEPHIAESVPDDVEDDQREEFRGFIIADVPANAFLDKGEDT